MRLLPILLALFTLTFASPAQESAPPDLLTSTERELSTLRSNLEKKRQAVAEAISTAAKAGTLKPSTEAYFRDLLEKLNSPEGTLPELEAAYFPPTFDTSEEMEPVNLAWRNLKQEITRTQSRTNAMLSATVDAATEAFQKVARFGSKPEELDPVDNYISLLRKLPESSRVRYSQAAGAKDVLQRLSESIRAALAAAQKNDLPAIATALSRVSNPGGMSMDIRGTLPFRTEAILDELRTRLSEPFIKEVHALQRSVEKAIMEGKSAADVEKLTGEFSTKAAGLDRLRELNRAGYNPSERTNLLNAYRSTLMVREAIKNGESEESGYSLPTQIQDGQLPMSPEFRAYLTNLRSEAQENRRKISVRLEAKRREESAQAEAQDRERRAEAQRKLREATNKTIAAFKEKIAALDSAEATLALANELPISNEERDPLANWNALQMELRQIGNGWLDGAPSQNVAANRAFDGYNYGHPFSVETQALRVRAARDVALKRFHVPQLKEPPYATMDLSMALDKLSQEAAAAGDWKRSYDLLRILPIRDPASSAPTQERVQALKTYLTGLNLETAGQFREAAEAYLSVIREVGDFLPTKEASTRLKALQKANPQLLKERREPTDNTRR